MVLLSKRLAKSLYNMSPQQVKTYEFPTELQLTISLQFEFRQEKQETSTADFGAVGSSNADGHRRVGTANR